MCNLGLGTGLEDRGGGLRGAWTLGTADLRQGKPEFKPPLKAGLSAPGVICELRPLDSLTQ